MNIKYIIFYNHNHNGDIHVSRSFVRAILQNYPDAVPCYFHNNTKRLTLDLCPSTHRPEFFDKDSGFYYKDNTLYVNTWYAASKGKYYKECTIQTLHTLFKQELASLEIDIIGNNPLDYLPSYDWKFYKTDKVKEYFDRQKRPHVLVCNNDVWSGQANNFDMMTLIFALADKFPNIDFVYTNLSKYSRKMTNVIPAEDILGFNNDNLPEIGFLSTFCSTIIGRSSGPYTFALNRENILENPKKFIGICTPETYNFGLSKLLDEDIFVRLDYDDKLLYNLSKLLEDSNAN